MANPWFRLYSEIRSDPKVRTMQEKFQIRLIWLFTLRCEGPTERMSVAELMYGLDCDETFLESIRETFVAKGFIESDWTVKHWNNRQYVSDSSSERVKKFRQKRALKQAETLHVTEGETDQNRTEHKKPSRRKPASDGMKHTSDPRHVACKEAIFGYYREKNSGVDPDWNGREGKALGMLLGANPKLTAEGMKRLLDHRRESEVNHSDRPGLWIDNMKSFLNGPIDRFGKPLRQLNGINGGGSKANPLEGMKFANAVAQ